MFREENAVQLRKLDTATEDRAVVEVVEGVLFCQADVGVAKQEEDHVVVHCVILQQAEVADAVKRLQRQLGNEGQLNFLGPTELKADKLEDRVSHNGGHFLDIAFLDEPGHMREKRALMFGNADR